MWSSAACRDVLGGLRGYVQLMILPESWAVVLQVFAPVFVRRGTLRMFTLLATGMAAQTGRRTVVGMLAGAGMAQRISFHAACRFFSAAVWDVARLGLAAAGLIVRCLLGPDEPIVVAVDVPHRRGEEPARGME